MDRERVLGAAADAKATLAGDGEPRCARPRYGKPRDGRSGGAAAG